MLPEKGDELQIWDSKPACSLLGMDSQPWFSALIRWRVALVARNFVLKMYRGAADGARQPSDVSD